MKFIIEKLLKFLVKKYLSRHKPKVIAITGSNGKTGAREAVYAVLKNKYKVRKSEKNYNTEIGVPLSVFGLTMPFYKIFWIFILIRAAFAAYFSKNAPEILILEMAADKPGDLKYLIDFIRPNISIITAIGKWPVHVEFFSGPRAVAEEKSYLVKTLETNGAAILNYDDKMTLEMQGKTKAHVFTFGFDEGAVFRAVEMQSDFDGTSFKLNFEGNIVPVRLLNVYGAPAVYAALSAFAVSGVLGLNLVETAEALSKYKAPPGRLNIVKAVRGAVILDDSYNASPLAMIAALDVLAGLPSKRKIAALGDMKELGRFSREAHEALGDYAAQIVDYIFVVGESAKFIAEGARKSGFNIKNIYEFDESLAVGKILKKLIKKGDLILVKGSQSMRMESVVEDIMANPERKKDLLVRQDWPWKK